MWIASRGVTGTAPGAGPPVSLAGWSHTYSVDGFEARIQLSDVCQRYSIFPLEKWRNQSLTLAMIGSMMAFGLSTPGASEKSIGMSATETLPSWGIRSALAGNAIAPSRIGAPCRRQVLSGACVAAKPGGCGVASSCT